MCLRWFGTSFLLAFSVASRAASGIPPGIYVDRLPGSLSGTWEFAPSDVSTGVDALDRLSWRTIEVPGTWQAQGVASHGTAWYRLRVELDAAVTRAPLAFACPQIRDADEVYFDGERVGGTGGFPPEYDKGTLVSRVYELPASLTSRPGTHWLVVRVHNPGPRGGGITAEPYLDSVTAALWARSKVELRSGVLAVALASLGLFSLFLFFREPERRDFLYYFLCTAGNAAYLATYVSAWSLGSIPLSTLFRTNFALLFFVSTIYVLFFYSFFERPLRLRHWVVIGGGAVGFLAAFFWPRVDDLYYLLPAAYLLSAVGVGETFYWLVVDARRGQPYARVILAAASLVLAGVLFDIGQDYGLYGDPVARLRLYGPTFFVFMTTFLAAMADRFAQLRRAATTDPLTGLSNRALLFERITLEVARARRHGHPVALALLDLDHFKSFNDKFGHISGDRLLASSAKAIVSSIRETDLAARYGGEEFAILLPEADRTQAVACLERIRQTIGGLRVSGATEGTTASIGVAVFDPGVRAGVSPTAWLRQADGALYGAKAAGRDRIVVAEGEPPTSSVSGAFSLSGFRRRPSGSKISSSEKSG